MKTLTQSTNGTLAVNGEHESISDRILLFHNIGRSCAAYAVFYGAMAGQELIRFKQKVGNRKFKPALEESMPWLAGSTAYLYIGYAKKFHARLHSIAPTAGVIDLKALPDPRDTAATEKTDLFSKVQEITKVNGAEQMWMALGLVKEAKERGGDTTGKAKKKTAAQRHAEYLANCRKDFEAVFAGVERLVKSGQWKAPSIEDPILEAAADSADKFVKQARKWLRTPKKDRAAIAAEIEEGGE